MTNGEINEFDLLLWAYYEALYEKLEPKKNLLTLRIEKLLTEEIEKNNFVNFDEQKYAAYRDTCLAFIVERIEAYNPIGFQYTFDRVRAKEVYDLELQLNWYDSRTEFETLLQAVRTKAKKNLTDEQLRLLADELISQLGAFPDQSIISAYEADPALSKLPDYVVARAIEEVIS